MRSSILLGPLLLCSLTGCSELWGGSTRPEHANCVRNPDACQPQEFCNAITEACELRPSMMLPDRSTFPAPPASFILPGGLSTSLDFPRDAVYYIATEGPATVYYTLDGSPPVPGMGTTQAAQSPLSLGALAAGTQVRWTTDAGPDLSLEPQRSFLTVTSNPTPRDMGSIPESALFDQPGGPVFVAAPGQALSGSVRFQAWQSTLDGFCPGCVIQYVVAVESVGAVGCVNTVTGFGSYPGLSSSVPFMLNAPLTPGRYRMHAGLTLQFLCDGTVPSGIDVGEIIVKG